MNSPSWTWMPINYAAQKSREVHSKMQNHSRSLKLEIISWVDFQHWPIRRNRLTFQVFFFICSDSFSLLFRRLGNTIRRLELKRISRLINLKVLILDKNKIKEIPYETFIQLEQLRTLSLSSNMIEKVNHIKFTSSVHWLTETGKLSVSMVVNLD